MGPNPQGRGSYASTLQTAQLLRKAADAVASRSRCAVVEAKESNVSESSEDRSSSALEVWLASEAERCPMPPCWRRLWDEHGMELFVHEHGAFPPQIVHPMLGYFVSLLSIARLASSAQDAQEVCDEVQACRKRIVEEAAELAAAYSGPLQSELGVEEWLCEETGWLTDVDPSMSPRYLLQVLKRLEEKLLASREKPSLLTAVAAAPTPRAAKEQLRSGNIQGKDAVTPAAALTPSTATPQSLALPTSPASRPGFTEGACNWFDVASPSGGRSPSCARSFSEDSDHDLETAYNLDWTSSAVKQLPCTYFSLDSPAATPEASTPRQMDLNSGADLAPESPDLEAAYGCDWSKALPAEQEGDGQGLEWETPEAHWQEEADLEGLTFSSPWEANVGSVESERTQSAASPEDVVRPQRLDFAASSPGSCTSGGSAHGHDTPVAEAQANASTYQDAVRVGVRKLFGDTLQKQRRGGRGSLGST